MSGIGDRGYDLLYEIDVVSFGNAHAHRSGDGQCKGRCCEAVGQFGQCASQRFGDVGVMTGVFRKTHPVVFVEHDDFERCGADVEAYFSVIHACLLNSLTTVSAAKICKILKYYLGAKFLM